MKLITGFLMPAAELILGWCWLAAGSEAAGRVLVFDWWLIVATAFGVAMLLVLVRLVSDKDFPMRGSTRASRIWSRTVFFARVVAQVAIGCTSLAVLSLAAWLFLRFALLLVTGDGAKNTAGA